MNSVIWHLACPRCGYRMDYEFIAAKSEWDVACPHDGWKMKNLQDWVSLSCRKESLMILSSAIRTLLAQKSCDIEKGQQILSMLNHVLGLFEDDTEFIDPNKEAYSYQI